jgi:cell wall-associated NlpC family hydrolase
VKATILPAGTIVCVQTRGLLGALIRLGTRSKVNHAVIYIGGGKIVEARARGAVVSEAADYDDAPQCNNAPQAAALAPDVAARIVAAAESFVGIGYGFLDIISLALIHGFGWRWTPLIARVSKQNRLICSQLVAQAWADGGYKLDTGRALVQDVTPDDLEWMIARRAWMEG